MRRFNEAGVQAFKAWVDAPVHDEAGLEVHATRMYSPQWTSLVSGTAEIPSSLRCPRTAYELGRAACDAMRGESPAILMEDEGLMCWLAVLFRDALFYKANGMFYVGNRHRHVFPDASSPRSDLRRRHLVRNRILMVTEHGDLAEGMLSTSPSGFSKLEEQYSSRADASFSFLRSDNFFAATNLMYVKHDESGCATLRPGAHTSFERLVVVGSQLDAAFDLGSMRPKDIVRLLPDEFSKFKRYAIQS